MSRKENRGIIDAYQKMLNDGTAFKEVDLTMHSEPDMGLATGAVSDSPLGDRVNENDRDSNIVEDDGYGEFDSIMEQRMNKLRNKAGVGGRSSGSGGNSEIISLKKRVKKLEEAIMLVMETQTKLIG